MIVDLFAGPGGWSEGLREIGLSGIGLEIDAAACATRAAAGHLTVRCDVAGYPVDPFVGKARGLIASPPCQAWSMAGKGAGRAEIDRVHAAVELCRDGWTDAALSWDWKDERTPLILQPLRWAWALRDTLDWIAMEQVPPALPVWEHMADVFRAWGFASDARVLCSADWGVPQTRNRAYLLASRGALRWPEPTHAEKPEPCLFGGDRLPWVTMAEALGWSGVLTGNNSIAGGPLAERGANDLAMTLGSRVDLWRLNPGQTATQPNRRTYGLDEPAPTVGFGHDANNWKWTLRNGASKNATERCADEPAPTLTSSMDNGDTKFVAGDESVRIAIAEAAVLQGFRADYPWQGTKSKQFEQVGNAVGPPMAAALIRALAPHTATPYTGERDGR